MIARIFMLLLLVQMVLLASIIPLAFFVFAYVGFFEIDSDWVVKSSFRETQTSGSHPMAFFIFLWGILLSYGVYGVFSEPIRNAWSGEDYDVSDIPRLLLFNLLVAAIPVSGYAFFENVQNKKYERNKTTKMHNTLRIADFDQIEHIQTDRSGEVKTIDYYPLNEQGPFSGLVDYIKTPFKSAVGNAECFLRFEYYNEKRGSLYLREVRCSYSSDVNNAWREKKRAQGKARAQGLLIAARRFGDNIGDRIPTQLIPSNIRSIYLEVSTLYFDDSNRGSPKELDNLADLKGLEDITLDTAEGPAETTVVETSVPVSSEPEEERDIYLKAYNLLVIGRYRDGIAEFEKFLSLYHDGTYSDQAHYWLGEANYVERRFEEAIVWFNVVIFEFPDSRKVPDARLRKGFALFELQRYSEARQELATVEREYLGRSIAAQARRRLQQMDDAGI